MSTKSVFDSVVFYMASNSERLSIPVINGIAAGFPSPATDYMEEGIDLNKELVRNPHWTFFGRVKGQSMKNAGIDEGDTIVVDKSLTPQHGRIAVCTLDGGFTLKRLHINGDKITLMPANPDFKPIAIAPESNFAVWGIVTYVIKKV